MGNIFKQIVNAVSAHITKNSGKYIAGDTITVAGASGYAIGKSVGHKDGKKEGTIEQAERDKKKMKI